MGKVIALFKSSAWKRLWGNGGVSRVLPLDVPALSKRLPAVQPDPKKNGLTFYRGLPAEHLATIQEKYSEGQLIHWSGLTSVSSSKDRWSAENSTRSPGHSGKGRGRCFASTAVTKSRRWHSHTVGCHGVGGGSFVVHSIAPI
eukprot:6458805-Amphidinium_carterae.1